MPGRLIKGAPRWSPLTWALIGYLILAGGVAWALYGVKTTQNDLRAQVESNTESTIALCAIRDDRRSRLTREKLAANRAQEYVRRYPNGLRIGDAFVSGGELRRSRDNAVATVRDTELTLVNLDDLNCEENP